MISGQKYFCEGACKDNSEEEAVRITSNTMSTNTANDREQAVGDGDENRYAELNIGDEEFVIYDRENHQAWIQSSVAVAVDDVQ